jgi:hypothetical protein
MMRLRFLIAGLAALCAFGCGSGETVSETQVAPSGEIEGKEPTFTMVPAQKDPNYKAGN